MTVILRGNAGGARLLMAATVRAEHDAEIGAALAAALRQLGGDVPVAHGMPIGYCESHLAKALRLAELLGDQAAAADVLARLAIVATNTLQFDRALDYGQRAVAAGRVARDDSAGRGS